MCWGQVFITSAGIKESSHHSESKDDRTHSHREAGVGAHPPVSLPGHASLRLPNSEQAASHPGWGLRRIMNHSQVVRLETLNGFLLYVSVVTLHVLLTHRAWRVCVTFVIRRFKPPLCLSVCECRLCEWWRDVYSFVPAGSLFWGGGSDLYRGDHSCSGAPAQGEAVFLSFCYQIFLLQQVENL